MTLLHFSAGQGPVECEIAIKKVLEKYIQEAGEHVQFQIVNQTDQSIIVEVTGEVEQFLIGRVGTVLWKCQSPVRKTHKRKNWFISVKAIEETDLMDDILDSDIQYQAIKASGPGGQHVNKTNSAIRATHIKTGLVATSSEQRSQFANKKMAKLKLAIAVAGHNTNIQLQNTKQLWINNHQVERGNPVRTYTGLDF